MTPNVLLIQYGGTDDKKLTLGGAGILQAFDDEVLFFPDWGHKWPLWGRVALRPEHLDLSEGLSTRLEEWVRTWQEDLDPIFEVRWPTPEQGFAWIEEGNRLCAEVQKEVEKLGIKIIPSFSMFSPDPIASPDQGVQSDR